MFCVLYYNFFLICEFYLQSQSKVGTVGFESNDNHIEEETNPVEPIHAGLPRTEWLNLDVTLVNGVGRVVAIGVV